MNTHLRITYRRMEPSEALNEAIREEAEKLERFHGRITACHVTVELPHRHHRRGRHFRVRVELLVPRGALVVGRDRALHYQHENPFVAVREVFQAARRRVQDHVRRQRREVKRHPYEEAFARAS